MTKRSLIVFILSIAIGCGLWAAGMRESFDYHVTVPNQKDTDKFRIITRGEYRYLEVSPAIAPQNGLYLLEVEVEPGKYSQYWNGDTLANIVQKPFSPYATASVVTVSPVDKSMADSGKSAEEISADSSAFSTTTITYDSMIIDEKINRLPGRFNQIALPYFSDTLFRKISLYIFNRTANTNKYTIKRFSCTTWLPFFEREDELVSNPALLNKTEYKKYVSSVFGLFFEGNLNLVEGNNYINPIPDSYKSNKIKASITRRFSEIFCRNNNIVDYTINNTLLHKLLYTDKNPWVVNYADFSYASSKPFMADPLTKKYSNNVVKLITNDFTQTKVREQVAERAFDYLSGTIKLGQTIPYKTIDEALSKTFFEADAYKNLDTFYNLQKKISTTPPKPEGYRYFQFPDAPVSMVSFTSRDITENFEFSSNGTSIEKAIIRSSGYKFSANAPLLIKPESGINSFTILIRFSATTTPLRKTSITLTGLQNNQYGSDPTTIPIEITEDSFVPVNIGKNAFYLLHPKVGTSNYFDSFQLSTNATSIINANSIAILDANATYNSKPFLQLNMQAILSFTENLNSLISAITTEGKTLGHLYALCQRYQQNGDLSPEQRIRFLSELISLDKENPTLLNNYVNGFIKIFQMLGGDSGKQLQSLVEKFRALQPIAYTVNTPNSLKIQKNGSISIVCEQVLNKDLLKTNEPNLSRMFFDINGNELTYIVDDATITDSRLPSGLTNKLYYGMYQNIELLGESMKYAEEGIDIPRTYNYKVYKTLQFAQTNSKKPSVLLSEIDLLLSKNQKNLSYLNDNFNYKNDASSILNPEYASRLPYPYKIGLNLRGGTTKSILNSPLAPQKVAGVNSFGLLSGVWYLATGNANGTQESAFKVSYNDKEKASWSHTQRFSEFLFKPLDTSSTHLKTDPISGFSGYHSYYSYMNRTGDITTSYRNKTEDIFLNQIDIEANTIVIPTYNDILPGDIIVGNDGEYKIGIVVHNAKAGNANASAKDIYVISVSKSSGQVFFSTWDSGNTYGGFTVTPPNFTPRRLGYRDSEATLELYSDSSNTSEYSKKTWEIVQEPVAGYITWFSEDIESKNQKPSRFNSSNSIDLFSVPSSLGVLKVAEELIDKNVRDSSKYRDIVDSPNLLECLPPKIEPKTITHDWKLYLVAGDKTFAGSNKDFTEIDWNGKEFTYYYTNLESDFQGFTQGKTKVNGIVVAQYDIKNNSPIVASYPNGGLINGKLYLQINRFTGNWEFTKIENINPPANSPLEEFIISHSILKNATRTKYYPYFAYILDSGDGKNIFLKTPYTDPAHSEFLVTPQFKICNSNADNAITNNYFNSMTANNQHLQNGYANNSEYFERVKCFYFFNLKDFLPELDALSKSATTASALIKNPIGQPRKTQFYTSLYTSNLISPSYKPDTLPEPSLMLKQLDESSHPFFSRVATHQRISHFLSLFSGDQANIPIENLIGEVTSTNSETLRKSLEFHITYPLGTNPHAGKTLNYKEVLLDDISRMITCDYTGMNSKITYETMATGGDRGTGFGDFVAATGIEEWKGLQYTPNEIATIAVRDYLQYYTQKATEKNRIRFLISLAPLIGPGITCIIDLNEAYTEEKGFLDYLGIIANAYRDTVLELGTGGIGKCVGTALKDANTVRKLTDDANELIKSQEYAQKILDDGIAANRIIANAAGKGAKTLFYKNIDEFLVTIKGAASVDKAVISEAFEYYKKGNWPQIETLFRKHNLNDFWPPANGGYNIVDNVPIKAGMKFDRFQFVDRGLDSKGFPVLAGDYTSPLIDNIPFSYEARALKANMHENTLYYQIEVLKDIPGLRTQDATIIPWWGKSGEGKQNCWKFSSDPISGETQTWRDLINEGYIRVKIIDSPNGTYQQFINKTIE